MALPTAGGRVAGPKAARPGGLKVRRDDGPPYGAAPIVLAATVRVPGGLPSAVGEVAGGEGAGGPRCPPPGGAATLGAGVDVAWWPPRSSKPLRGRASGPWWVRSPCTPASPPRLPMHDLPGCTPPSRTPASSAARRPAPHAAPRRLAPREAAPRAPRRPAPHGAPRPTPPREGWRRAKRRPAHPGVQRRRPPRAARRPAKAGARRSGAPRPPASSAARRPAPHAAPRRLAPREGWRLDPPGRRPPASADGR